MTCSFQQGVEFSHWLVKQQVKAGAWVIDATVGKGNDTSFLAQLVGEDGFVWGFDIQQEAIDKTRSKLLEAGLEKRVTLICDGHQHLKKYAEPPVEVIMFNLGYLPGSDKEIITQPGTTRQALQAGLDLLAVGGLITLVVYPEHEGGQKEKEVLIDYTSSLENKPYNVLHYHFLNQPANPPEVIAIKKRAAE